MNMMDKEYWELLVRGVRLIHLASLKAYLRGLMAEQAKEAQP